MAQRTAADGLDRARANLWLMTRDRRTTLHPNLWRPQRDEGPPARSSWQPSFPDESRDWSRQLSEEMRPLVESLQRLRDRGLLE